MIVDGGARTAVEPNECGRVGSEWQQERGEWGGEVDTPLPPPRKFLVFMKIERSPGKSFFTKDLYAKSSAERSCGWIFGGRSAGSRRIAVSSTSKASNRAGGH
jgi:hypothetical protein